MPTDSDEIVKDHPYMMRSRHAFYDRISGCGSFADYNPMAAAIEKLKEDAAAIGDSDFDDEISALTAAVDTGTVYCALPAILWLLRWRAFNQICKALRLVTGRVGFGDKVDRYALMVPTEFQVKLATLVGVVRTRAATPEMLNDPEVDLGDTIPGRLVNANDVLKWDEDQSALVFHGLLERN